VSPHGSHFPPTWGYDDPPHPENPPSASFRPSPVSCASSSLTDPRPPSDIDPHPPSHTNPLSCTVPNPHNDCSAPDTQNLPSSSTPNIPDLVSEFPAPTLPPNPIHSIPTISAIPTLRRSSHIPISSSRNTTRDGLLDCRLVNTVSDVTAAAARRKEEHLSCLPTPHGGDHSAFLTEFAPICDSHEIFPVELQINNLPVSEVLTAISDGSLSPELDSGDDPSWADALASPDREYWIAGVREELKSLEDLQVFVLVPKSAVPSGHRLLKGKLVCKRKRDDMGNIIQYKVRYIAKGYAQQHGIDYDKTCTPTARLESFRSILHLAATLDWDLQQFDVKTAFLHGVLPADEVMFMEQPSGFEVPGKEDWVMRLMKSIYGMKQASRIWNLTFHDTVKEWGFECLTCEWCVY
jgi:Reverse transcriptase (RNA-dependent DNA polymerase)